MKFYTIWVSVIFSVIFSACGAISGLDGEDANLPQIGKVRVLSDVSAIAFEWEKISDARIKGVALYRADPNEREFSEVAYIEDTQTTHFVDTNLTPESEYRYFFRTIGWTHYSTQSPVIKATTSFIDAVERVFASNDYPRQVKLIFSPHSNPSISHYLIQRKIDGEFKTIALVNHRLMPEYFDKNLDDGTSYEYRVVAMDFNGAPSRPSKVVVAKTKAIPKSPQNLTASKDLLNKIELHWIAPARDIKSYNIYRAKSLKSKFNLIASSQTLNYTDEVNATGAEFFYKITSIDSTNLESEFSNTAQGQTKPAPYTPQIKGYVNNKEAIIAWSAIKSAKYYIIFRIDLKTSKQTRYKVSETIFNDKEVSAGGQYSYEVMAVSDEGLESAHSNKVILTLE